MAKILIAEDELIYREYLAAALDAEGHEVRSCFDGRDAIKVGSFFRPDVLIADWMLKSHVHGLHVARVLRHLNPKQHTILITGFASADLMFEAEADQIFAFIRKPFDLGELKEKVAEAARRIDAEAFQSEIGFLEVDNNNNIQYANAKMSQIFRPLQACPLPQPITSLPVDADGFSTGLKSKQWFEMALTDGSEARLHCYPLAYADKDSSLVVVLNDEQRFYKKSRLLELLISAHTRDAERHYWPFEGRVLLVDSNSSLRRLAIDLFDSAGALCHSTDSYTAALKTIERDVGIRYVIIDYEIPDRLSYAGGLARFIETIRTKLPNATILGQSERNRAKDFADLGVPYFVQKPWTLEQLIDVITGQ